MPDGGVKRSAGKPAAKSSAAKRAAQPGTGAPARESGPAEPPRKPAAKPARKPAAKSAGESASPAAGVSAAARPATKERTAARAAAPPKPARTSALAAARATAADPGGSDVERRPAHGPGSPGSAGRLSVRKTYKLFIGGKFPRSESGRSYPVTGPGGALLAQAALASRKDARDAVVAARGASGGWSGATAYNRGQVLYRVAELLEGRRVQFAAEIVRTEGLDLSAADDQVARAIDRWVWYAGWPDKVAQVAGAANPVAGPYFNFSVPEPTGVVAVVAPAGSSLLGLVSVVAPVIATGNTAVVVASEDRPLPAVTLTEVLATSDVPPGVVNVLTGRTAELAPVLAAHMDVNAIDLSGVALAGRAELERLAAGNVKRVFAADEDWAEPPRLRRMLAFLETKTVWHPVGI
jgi:hypothetical protein